jgi:hypothetical protein
MLAQQEEVVPSTALDSDLNELLNQERGWGEVGAGLTRILIGWGILVGAIALGIGLLVLSVFLSKPAMYWAFFGGMASIGVCGFLSWTTILGGLLRCLMNSPERLGVRWFIFICMLCLAIGPILNITSSFLCSTERPEFDKGVEGLRKIRLDPTGRFIQAMCMIGSVGYNIAFILFLRSVGCCFRSLLVLRLTELYLLLYVGLVGAMFYLALFQLPLVLRNPHIIVGVGMAAFMLFIFYVMLVILARSCIVTNIAKVRSVMGQAVFASV